MRCAQCGKDISAGISQCPYCQAPIHYSGNTTFVNKAAQNKVDITDFFSNIFSSQPAGAGDRMFISGTALTTPTPDRMLQEWNKPWLYARFLLLGLIFCLLCYFMFKVQEHSSGMFFLFFCGSLIVPMSVLIFYWEINIPRDIPFYRVLMVFFIGGMLSLIFTLLIWKIHGAPWIAPLFEEPGKVLALAIFIYWFDIRYIFGGLLIGAAVGAGFAAFEDIQYVTSNLLSPLVANIVKIMLANPNIETAKQILQEFNMVFYELGSDILISREIRAIGMHVTWAAIEGGALAMVKGKDSFSPTHLFSPRFLIYMIAAMFLHFAWNGGLYEGSGLVSLITVTEENKDSVENILHATLCLAAVLLSFTLIRQAIFQVLDVVNSASNQAPATPVANANMPMLLATNGPLANALFPLERRITFGRDPALCNVVFPSGTPGVSRRHCVLEPRSDGMYLMDLGSSSGTFIDNLGGFMHEKRLPANQWVKVNGKFFLGSPNVMFTIQSGNGQGQQHFQPPVNQQQQIPPPVQLLVNPTPIPQSVVTIICIAGSLQGKTFSDPQRLIIGREPSQCNVVFPPRTPGVSRRHCILERRQGEVYIMDVGSSSGTFFQNGNGQRLPLNQWIKVTDNFYLGSPNVMFSVN